MNAVLQTISARALAIVTMVTLVLSAFPASFFNFSIASAAGSDTLFSDGFESGDFTEWDDARAAWSVSGGDTNSGSYRADANGTSSNQTVFLGKNVDTSGYENITLEFWYRLPDGGLETNERIQIYGSDDGSGFSAELTLTEDDDADSWTKREVTFPASTADNPNFGFRFGIFAGVESDEFQLDDVSLTADPIAAEPDTSTVTLCKQNTDEDLLSGWELFLTDGQTEYGGTTNGDGCVEVSDVPYGTYTLEEVLQDGWENVSGKGAERVVDEETELFYVVNQELETEPTEKISPILECVEELGDAEYRAHWGYETKNEVTVAIPVGDDNKLTGGGLSGQDQGQTTEFAHPAANYPSEDRKGRTGFYPDNAFATDFDGSNLVWTLTGPDGQTRTATANADSNACPVEEPDPELPEPCSLTGSVTDYTADESALQNNGDPVSSDRRDPTAVETLAPYQNDDGKEQNDWVTSDFFALGIEGFLVYEFTDKVAYDEAGPDIAIYEITGGPAAQQSDEKVTVSVSQNGVDYVEIGTYTGDAFVDIAGSGLDYVKYVRLDDRSSGVQGANGDGFDVDAIAILDDSCGDAPAELTVVASKIECTNESELPNYGAGGPNMTAATAQDWVDSHDSCDFVEGWEFEWAPFGTDNPGDELVGPAGGDWTTFGPTDTSGVTTITLPFDAVAEDGKFWVREVLQEDYLPFTFHPEGKQNTDDESAEIYCHTDVKNYDNYDRIDGLEADATYHCVAWNHQPEPPAVCEPGVELLANASFEKPVVSTDAGWDIYEDGTADLEWGVDWIDATGAPENGWLELHRDVDGWLASAGKQHAELDADWQGPSGGSGEPASVAIAQSIPTVAGETYTLSWDFSARPNTDAGENVLEVLVDGSLEATNSAANNTSQTEWQNDSLTFTGTGDMVTVTFRDAGASNSRGTLLDNVSLSCSAPEPDEEAKIKVFKVVKNQPVSEVDLTQFSFQVDDMSPIGFSEWGVGYDYLPVGDTYTVTEANVPGDYTHLQTMCHTYNAERYHPDMQQDVLSHQTEGAAMPEAFGGYLEDETWPPGWEPVNTVTLEDEDDYGVCLMVNVYEPEVAQCEIGSDTGSLVVGPNAFAVAAYDGNDRWTANIPGATWIWNTEFAENPDQDETYTFRETFTVNDPEAGILDIAADNGYRVTINGSEVVDRSDQPTNFTNFAQKSFDVAGYLNDGENTMEVEVTNVGLAGKNALQNPAGVLYKLTIDSEVACERTTAPEESDDTDNGSEDDDGGSDGTDGSDEGDGRDTSGGNSDEEDGNNDEISTTRGSSGGGGSFLGRRDSNDRPLPQVAGVATSAPTQCGPLLSSYLRQGIDNDSWEVKKLQLFLLSQGYDVPLNGEFGDRTDSAVRDFQSEHQKDVLTPWYEEGLVPHDNPTGWVYMTTRWKINNIVCPDSENLPDITRG